MMEYLFTPLPVADMAAAFLLSNLAGQVIVVVLFAGSIYVWAMMLTKHRQLKVAEEASAKFLDAYRKESHPAGLFVHGQRLKESPFYVIYEQACMTLGEACGAGEEDGDGLSARGGGTRARPLNEARIRGVRHVCERTMADQLKPIESGMLWLATAVTTAPFLGLLGTVWGVLDSFGAIAVQGSAMLSAVAPGISGALLTTVIGLLVALPSAIGYNLLSERIRQLSGGMDNFVQEFMCDVEQRYMEESEA